jgi:hypothetical protein
MPASQFLDILRRRVTYLEGGVNDLQRAVEAAAENERRAAARLGSRDRTWVSSMAAGVAGAAFGLPQMLLSRWLVNTYSSWGQFDQQTARIIGPMIRDLGSRVVKYEEFGLPSFRQRLGAPAAGEADEIGRLIERGNVLSNRAERLARAFRDSPAGAFDSSNAPWTERFLRRANRGSVVLGIIQRGTGGERELAARMTGSSFPGGSPGALPGATPQAATSIEEELVRHGGMAPTRPGQQPSGEPSGYEPPGAFSGLWPGLVTAALVVAGGYLVVQIVKSFVATPEGETAEAEE